jgi:hypothetical protein
MWKEVVMMYFKELFQHFPGGTDETHGNFNQYSWYPGRGSNRASPEYKREALPLESTSSVHEIQIERDWIVLSDT